MSLLVIAGRRVLRSELYWSGVYYTIVINVGQALVSWFGRINDHLVSSCGFHVSITGNARSAGPIRWSVVRGSFSTCRHPRRVARGLRLRFLSMLLHQLYCNYAGRTPTWYLVFINTLVSLDAPIATELGDGADVEEAGVPSPLGPTSDAALLRLPTCFRSPSACSAVEASPRRGVLSSACSAAE